MTTTHDAPETSRENTLVPGRIYFLGYRNNGTNEPGNPVPDTPTGYSRTWLYLVAIVGDTLFGVAFANVRGSADPIGASVPTSLVTHQMDNGGAHHTPGVVGWWADMLADYFRAATTGTPTSGDQDTDQAYRRGVNDGRAAASREFDAWKARAEEIAHEYADNNDLCSEFDRCMEDVGLSPRGGHTYRIVVDVTLPRGRDPWDMDLEDLYSESEDTSMVDVTRI